MNRRIAPYRMAMPQYATVLDGSTQYWSKSSPVNMDLNGSELGTNGDFETGNVNGWSASNASGWSASSSIKHSGTYAGVATANGSADMYVYLTTAITNTSTDKYTAEAWLYCPTANVSKSVAVEVCDQTNTAFRTPVFVTLTANTWTKVVCNVQLSGSQTGIRLYARLQTPTSGDILRIDDCSLTQAYDAMFVFIYSSIVPNNAGAIIDLGLTGSTITRFLLKRNSNSTIQTLINSNNVGYGFTGGSDIEKFYNTLITTIDRTGNIETWLNGISIGTASSASIGNFSGITQLTIGYKTPTASGVTYFGGNISLSQFIRFNSLPSDIAQTIARINAAWKQSGLPQRYDSGTIVANYDWRLPGVDLSGNGNTLTATGSPQTMQIG